MPTLSLAKFLKASISRPHFGGLNYRFIRDVERAVWGTLNFDNFEFEIIIYGPTILTFIISNPAIRTAEKVDLASRQFGDIFLEGLSGHCL